MSLTDLVAVPEGINVLADGRRLQNAKQATMLALLGSPRADLNQDCQAVATPSLKALMVTSSVGPFRVTGLRPAVESLRAIMADIAAEQPAVYRALGSAGMLCVRYVRGSRTAISNHAWGTAIDLTIGGILDPYGDGKVQRGLVDIYPIFNRHEWFWGAAFSKEDGMHFEVSDGLIRSWLASGRFGSGLNPPETFLLSLGDRGDEVRYVQEALNLHEAGLLVDGIFGRETQAAIFRFQAREAIRLTGLVDGDTWSRVHVLRRDGGLKVLYADAAAPAVAQAKITPANKKAQAKPT
ncbi:MULTISPECIES: M15 family metallopeptidase [Roseomonadaceae]|uniref:M15 family metallopeptidase n=1 Tax=Falsiroseomonas oleicola TaxID=2801474 RepID=A0ABS6HBP1_9PROT|nr:M15 family metallopeptidase [Roseomonas oleicola]MBU8546142.1 M15 family metallopeptidase [Roseomonas oleicola]